MRVGFGGRGVFCIVMDYDFNFFFDLWDGV
jgi:hypothetical protein